MFIFFKKQKQKIIVNCYENLITIDNNQILFPTNFQKLITIFGEPSRTIQKEKKYFFWDELGIFCGCLNQKKIVSLNFYQNKKDKNIYNTKKQFKGRLLFNDKDITINEFEKIDLGSYAIYRLGSEDEIKHGFSIGLNRFFKNS